MTDFLTATALGTIIDMRHLLNLAGQTCTAVKVRIELTTKSHKTAEPGTRIAYATATIEEDVTGQYFVGQSVLIEGTPLALGYINAIGKAAGVLTLVNASIKRAVAQAQEVAPEERMAG